MALQSMYRIIGWYVNQVLLLCEDVGVATETKSHSPFWKVGSDSCSHHQALFATLLEMCNSHIM